MKKRVLSVMVCVMAVVNIASADIIRGIEMDFVTIGHAGNAADTQVMSDGTTGYGSVGRDFRIGKYEVTNAQWNTFTGVAGTPTGNDGGYSYSASYTGAQQPTNMVSWYETLQFCNYLTSGDKSKGVYQFSGNNTNPGDFIGIGREAAQAVYGTIYYLPTEDEWYKAAYYKPNGSGYSLYANGTGTAPIAGVQSNYNLSGTVWDVNKGTEEQNGTFNMMGNVFEWNELINGPYRGLRGGSFYSYGGNSLGSSGRDFHPTNYPNFEDESFGFRVASTPEPATLLLLGLGGLVLRKRK